MNNMIAIALFNHDGTWAGHAMMIVDSSMQDWAKGVANAWNSQIHATPGASLRWYALLWYMPNSNGVYFFHQENGPFGP